MRVVDEKILAEFRRKPACEWCGCRAAAPLHPHHLWCRGMGGGGRLDVAANLVALCWCCHRSHHSGLRPLTEDLLAVVAARHGVLQDDVLAALRAVRRLPKGSSREEVEGLLSWRGA